MKKFNFIDLCAGIGGFHLAFQPYAKCLLTCEIDKFCKQTYLANHQTKKWVSDIKKIIPQELENFDILCAGFPCQAFSLAGKRKGFDDIRGTIFFDIVNIVKIKRPQALFLENVKNLKTHDKGNTYKIITESLDKLNYWHETFIMNAQYFVPQKRERIYIIGLDKDKYSKEDFDSLVNRIKKQYKKQEKNNHDIHDILEKDLTAQYTLSPKLWNFLQKHEEKHRLKGNGFGYGLIRKQDALARTLTARYYKDGSEILIEQKENQPRKLTPRECARLMGYPDEFKIVVSNTQAYKQFGNSVVVPVLKLFSKQIMATLRNKK